MTNRALACSSTAAVAAICRHHSAAALLVRQQQQQHRRRFVSARVASVEEVDAAAVADDASVPPPPSPSVPPTTFRVSLSDVSPAATSPLVAPLSLKPPRLRLDTFLSSRLAVSNSTGARSAASTAAASTTSSSSSSSPPSSASRARVAAAVRSGLVSVNGVVKLRPSEPLRVGDAVSLSTGGLPPPPPLNAVPEPQSSEAPLFGVAFEDDQVIVVDKAAGVVVHPGARHQSGTLVNVLLYHCGVREAVSTEGDEEGDERDDDDDDEDGDGDLDDAIPSSNSPPASASSSSAAAAASSAPKQQHRYRTPPSLLTGSGTRPGIVHRLDKGTTGLLVVAKTPEAHASLAGQFRDRSVRRRYVSLCVGVPRVLRGVVETNIDRGLKERTRMEAFPFEGRRGRPAVSEFRVVEVLAGGGASLVEWRLRTGRTHQIRVHARHIGCPLLGDEAYGGGTGAGPPRRRSPRRPREEGEGTRRRCRGRGKRSRRRGGRRGGPCPEQRATPRRSS